VRFKLLLVVFLIAVFALNTPLAAHEGDEHEGDDQEQGETGVPLILGVLDFPNSGAEDAQDAFTRGVLLLHSFEFDDARSAFLEAQAVDPGFVMAIWGEAMTHNHPLWADQERDDALKALARLPPESERKITAREQAFLDAVESLYGFGEDNPGDKPSRDIAYMLAMQRAHEAFPDDLEVASFYALSILGSVYERDFRTYMRAAAILEEVFAKQPRHPGAAHYLIHSYDDQVHAPLGLRAARVYATIAPAASHAQHMISHIYTSLGRWEEVVAANIIAVRVSEEAMLRAGKPVARRTKHAMHWLQYAFLQQGLYGEARKTMEVMKQDREELNDLYQNESYVMFRASYIADDPAGEQPLKRIQLPDMPLDYSLTDDFATGYNLLAMGKLNEAAALLREMQDRIASATVKTVEEGLHEDELATSEDGYLVATIMTRELEALLLYRGGKTDAAIDLLRGAAADENGRALVYGPPHIPKPPNELLGEMLLALGRPQEAITGFELSLLRNTNRSLALLGLARAQEAAGHTIEAAETQALLASNWKGDLQALRQSSYPCLGD
jgi:tetratricopeptide (TPR) repeat protein